MLFDSKIRRTTRVDAVEEVVDNDFVDLVLDVDIEFD